ncbi:MAG: TonB family protein, partial [Terriglobales bacterium]
AHTSPNRASRLRSAGFVRQFTSREKSVVVPQSKPSRFRKTLSHSERNSTLKDSSDHPGDPSDKDAGNCDENTALSSLRESIASGDHRLDPLLGMIADAACQLTGSSGAALAMWKDGFMVCRARSGRTAPALGARLSANTGISGECLRTGEMQHCRDTENDLLVDMEVCRTLGLRSIAVLPIQGWRGLNGILEVFSTEPAAFTGAHIALLQQLAALAERARATQPQDASAVVPKPRSAVAKTPPAGLLPASDRVGDVAFAVIGSGRSSRAFVLGAIGVVAISLLALVIWLGWRGADEADAKSRVTSPSAAIVSTAMASASVPRSSDLRSSDQRSSDQKSSDQKSSDQKSSDQHLADQHPPAQPLPDGDPVWKRNPGGEALFSSGAKPSAGSPIKFAAKVDGIREKKVPADRAPLLADLASKVASNPAIPHTEPDPQTELRSESSQATSHPGGASSDESASNEAQSILANSTNSASLNTVLSAKASLPRLTAPVSVGVSGGQLVHRVAPVYPVLARELHQQGTVTLSAVVLEDGTLREVKVVEGPAVFASAAVEAVKHWRYKPFMLDGKRIRNEVRINVDFKFPEDH